MRRIVTLGTIIVLLAVLAGSAHAMTWQQPTHDIYSCPGSGMASQFEFRYNIVGSPTLTTTLTISPGPHSQRSRSYVIPPNTRETVCIDDKGVFTDTYGGDWVVKSGWGDTPPFQFKSSLGTYCNGQSRTWYEEGTQPLRTELALVFGAICVPNNPNIKYNNRPSPASFTFTPAGAATLRYERKFECNLDGGIVRDGESDLEASLATKIDRPRVVALSPTDPKIYRTDTKSVSYPLEVLAPLSLILTTSGDVDKNQVYPGETFLGTVTIRNRVGWSVDLDSYSISGDLVGGRHICSPTLTPVEVSAHDSVQAIISCTVPVGTPPQIISGIRVSFNADVTHPCSGDDSYTVEIPSVRVLEPMLVDPCEDNIDNDGDGKFDCEDNDGLEDCCMYPDCPFKDNEGAKGYICCNNGKNEDGDARRDCWDTDCCRAPTCPTGPGGNEGANHRICCSNTLDDDIDGLTDIEDPDCQIRGPCEDGIDNDGDCWALNGGAGEDTNGDGTVCGAGDEGVDCWDNNGAENCCTASNCPFGENEGANGGICCANWLNEDGGPQDCLDPDCCLAAVCPYDDTPNSEGANGMICCVGGDDEDHDGLADGLDPDCRVLGPCEDGIDNDNDGLIDCNDSQEGGVSCCIDPACPMFGANEGANNYVCCNNGRDEDGGGIDCLDPDCCLAAVCPYDDTPNSEGANEKLCCANSLDEDNDGLPDGADPDCIILGPCEDSIDNDGDGKIDCLDNDGAEACCASPACPVYAVNEGANNGTCCNNTIDEDNDTAADCLDLQCCAAPTCPFKINEGANDKLCCANTKDDDNDGFADLLDTDCQLPYEICNDTIDNDGDGLVDCLDPYCCNDTVACPVYLTNEGANNFTCCANLRDEDGNGATDCLDTSCCAAVDECPVYLTDEGANGGICCANTLDEDGDSVADCLDDSCCAAPTCPFGANEGANGGICCANWLNEDGGAMDCLDDDCCNATICPYDDNFNSEGLNGMICCANNIDDDGDGKKDTSDPDCIVLGPCADREDNDGDGLIDCNDPDGTEDCCMDPACSTYFGANEGGAGPNSIKYICCNNGKNEDGDARRDCWDTDCCQASNCPTSSNEGANNYMCCANNEDDDEDDLTDFDDPDCVNYNGIFNDMALTGEIRTFPVNFGDKSIAEEDPVPWQFIFYPAVDYEGVCLTSESISKLKGIPKNDDGMHPISNLTLYTTSDSYCAATVHAFAPDGTEVNGSYILDMGSLPPIGPGSRVPDIPSIIHPINIYSDDPTDAQDSYNLSEGVVAALLADCGTECGGNAAAKAKLDDAWRHLKAAERYLAGCMSGQSSLCRFSQYYSERANQLGREGQAMLA